MSIARLVKVRIADVDPICAIAPLGVERDPIGRMGDQKQRFRIAEQSRHNSRISAVAADQPVTRDYSVIGVCEDRVRPPKFLDRHRDLIDLRLAVSAGIPFVGLQPLDWPALDLDIDFRRRTDFRSFRHDSPIAILLFSRQQRIEDSGI
ncbi:MAG TPA: hypothetical protein VN519_13915 [Bryobacteraceae bacterium]|nr:hypothetical protein [Bryobacteraceae bacterium]